MIDIEDEIDSLYPMPHSVDKTEEKESWYPDWVKSERHKKFFDAIDARYKLCQTNIINIKRNQVDKILKRDVTIQGTAVCILSGINRKSLTEALQPDVTAEINARNKVLSKLLLNHLAKLNSDKRKRKPALLEQNQELKKTIHAEKTNNLTNLFKAFEESEWATSLDSVYERLKKTRGQNFALEKENAKLRAREIDLVTGIEKLDLTIRKLKEENSNLRNRNKSLKLSPKVQSQPDRKPVSLSLVKLFKSDKSDL